MANLAVIPARGGSKRIPRKNIKDFCGKPIIAYSIEVALESGLFDEVMVSTDDGEILEIAKKYGAEVPFMRSKENSNDYATLSDVVDEVKLSYLKENKYFEYICCILPTSPLITVESLKRGYWELIEKNADSVSPVVRFSYPIQRALRMINNKIQMFDSKYRYSRSQDLESAYHDAGQFYWMKYDVGLRGKEKYGFEIPESQSQDIDNDIDFEIAQMKYRLLKNSNFK
ncbi:MAG: pseudaminic acid cytidylyltransferase [Dysgonomonas sp.]